MTERRRRKTSPGKIPKPAPRDGAVQIPGELAREMRPELWDPTDPGFRLWTPRDTTGDPRREAGPFWPHRQARGPAWLGIPTFFRLPVALAPEDLRAGRVEVSRHRGGADVPGDKFAQVRQLQIELNGAYSQLAEAGLREQAADFGLDPPLATLAVRTESGPVLEIAFGKATPLGFARYARVTGRPGIVILPSYVADTWEQVASGR